MNGHFSALRYSDPQAHATSLRDFDQNYVQVEDGPFGSALTQAEFGGLRIYVESVDRGIVQHTHLNKNCIAMGWGRRGASARGARQVVETSAAMLRGGQDWMFRLKPGIELFGITMPTDEIDRLAESIGVSIALTRHAPIKPSARALANMQWCVSEVERQAPRMANAQVRASLREHLLENFFEALCESQPQGRADVTWLSHQQIVRRSQELALASPDRPPSVLDLCAQLRVSRRTLHNSFLLVLGQSPSAYLRCMRMGRVRLLLRTVPASELSVGDAAARWGFFHVGNFAKDYRNLFDELPSQTPRARP